VGVSLTIRRQCLLLEVMTNRSEERSLGGRSFKRLPAPSREGEKSPKRLRPPYPRVGGALAYVIAESEQWDTRPQGANPGRVAPWSVSATGILINLRCVVRCETPGSTLSQLGDPAPGVMNSCYFCFKNLAPWKAHRPMTAL
jgi:hypothetical protein